MEYLFNIINLKKYIGKIILFLFSIGLLLFMFPHNVKFKYEYQKNKPWMHETMISPFDFPILKTNKELEQEKKQIVKNRDLYFKNNTDAIINAHKIYSDEYKNLWRNYQSINSAELAEYNIDSIENLYYMSGKRLLDSIYKIGVIQLHDILLKDSIKNIKKVEILVLNSDNTATHSLVGDYLTVQEVNKYINSHLYILDSLNIKQNGLQGVLHKGLVEEALQASIFQNIVFDEETTNQLLTQELDNILPAKGMVEKGVRVISKGEIIDEAKFQQLESLKIAYLKNTDVKSNWWIYFGQFFIISFSMLLLVLFLIHFRNDIWENNKRIVFILLLFLFFTIVHIYVLRTDKLNYIYFIPFCIYPILIRIFFDIRLAIFTYILFVLLNGYLAPNGFEFVFIETISGLLAVFSMINLHKRASVFITSAVIFASLSISFLALEVIREGAIFTIDSVKFFYFGGSAILTLLSYPVIYIFEKVFGFISDFTLLELSDTNSPLLRKLSEKAPGTFQHSLQVASLSEAAVYEIGGNPLLVRAGAMYHDIGKLKNPMYFTENQSTGFNPHTELSFDESAKLITEHIKYGIEIAKKHKLPDQVIDFIRTHQGTTKVMYFYKKYIEQYPEEPIDEKMFAYPGPKPFSKETAILMMADGIEASSRSLKYPNPESIDELVERIINGLVSANQFSNANITFKEISQIKKLFKKKILNIYHNRIEYPK